MAIEFAERGADLPDTIPAHLIDAHGRAARRTVARSFRPDPADVVDRWLARTSTVAAVVALLGFFAALVFFAVVIPVARLPLAGLVLAMGMVAAIDTWARSRRQR